MKIQPKPISNPAGHSNSTAIANSAGLASAAGLGNASGLTNQLKNNNTILSPLTQHLQAALKQHQAMQQQQVCIHYSARILNYMLEGAASIYQF